MHVLLRGALAAHRKLLVLSCMQLSLWDLQPLSASTGSSSSNSLQPSATTPIPAGDVQSRICYNPDDPSELLTNGKRRAYFWRSQLPGSNLISYYSPPLRAGDFHQDVGDFVASVFVPGTTQVRVGPLAADAIKEHSSSLHGSKWFGLGAATAAVM
jgi:hypothetical protein